MGAGMLKLVDVDVRRVSGENGTEWVATSDAFPDLYVQAQSLAMLEEQLAFAVPALLRKHEIPADPSGLQVRVRYVRSFAARNVS